MRTWEEEEGAHLRLWGGGGWEVTGCRPFEDYEADGHLYTEVYSSRPPSPSAGSPSTEISHFGRECRFG